MPVSKSLLVDSALILALILVGVAGYQLSPLLMPKADLIASPDPGCDLQQTLCGATLPDGGRVTFSLLPRPIAAVAPLDVLVEVEGRPADRVAVDFTGVSMNMGLNRTTLTTSGAGRFTGQSSLPVCVTGRMSWQATVLVETAQTRIAIPFRFDVGHGA